ncbi:unnamed protein product [Cuscuta campestris]|uniref:Reverse transcriptase domain-containing protein n=1 Tax=Cuscuta campestris TaxID=132261 RepID=A0A484LI85_9ASTE|nr:unnamed protein product [Cuscuta campestris]
MFSCLVHHLDRVGSDHAPLLVECKSHERPPARPFTFLNVWTEHEDFQKVVADSWREDITGNPMFVFGAKLKRLAHSLKRWNRDTFSHIFGRLKVLEQDVRDIELQLQTDSSDETYIEFKRRSTLLKRQYRIEDEFWRQKAHAKWVTDGERNSGYFHSVVKDRQRKLYIHRIQDDRGQWVTERAAIGMQAITFFQAMFTADPSVTSSALDMIPRLVTDEDNDRLCAVPEMEEVKTAVFAMDSRSAAGPDGYTGAFYKAAWTIICTDLLAMVQAFFLGHDLTRPLTHTSIVLLPKKPNPVTFADFRPISLCNYCKKIITKIMVVRLASVLPRLLSSHQSGFVAGHSITDNILLAQEMCHGMRVDNDDVILKLDMMKAYDRVSWTLAIWTTFMRAKYCSRVHPVSKQRGADDSHTWKRMLDVRAVVEPVIRWRVLSGTSNFWWDTWSGLGALHRQVDGCSGYWTDGVGDMYCSDSMIDHDALPPDLLRQLRLELPSLVSDHVDIPVWTPSTDGKFTLASAKELLRPRRHDEVEDIMLKWCWQKHLPYKMSFLAWRVLERRLPTDDVLARFGFALPSRCLCCSPPGRETITHIFYHGSMARRVWTYFTQSARIRGTHHSLRSVLSIYYAACKYGDACPNFARIIFRVATAVSECIYRRWPSGGLLPSRWSVIMEHVRRGFGCRRVVPIGWVPPPGGTIKVNVARAPLRGAFAAIVRDSTGKFLYALSSIAFRWEPVERGGMDVLLRCIQWCISQSFLRIHVESHHSELACFFREGHLQRSCVTRQWFHCDVRANAPTTELALWAVDSTEGTREFTNLQDLDIRVRSLLPMDDLPFFRMDEDGDCFTGYFLGFWTFLDFYTAGLLGFGWIETSSWAVALADGLLTLADGTDALGWSLMVGRPGDGLGLIWTGAGHGLDGLDWAGGLLGLAWRLDCHGLGLLRSGFRCGFGLAHMPSFMGSGSAWLAEPNRKDERSAEPGRKDERSAEPGRKDERSAEPGRKAGGAQSRAGRRAELWARQERPSPILGKFLLMAVLGWRGVIPQQKPPLSGFHGI